MPPELNDDQPVFHGIDEALDFMSKQESESAGTTTEDEEEETLEETVEPEIESEDSDEEQPEEETEEETDVEEEEEDYIFQIEDEDGEIVNITDKEEAKKGYLRQRQFTKVTQEVAAERKELQAEKAQTLELKGQYLNSIAQYKAASSEKLSRFMNVDWETLQKEDPIGFDETKSEFEAAKLAYEQSNQEQQKVDAELTQETIQYANQVRAEEMQKLQTAYPELLDADSTLLEDAKNHALSAYGFSEQEINSIYDSRQIQALIDAFTLNKTKGKLKVGKAKAKTISKSIKPKAAVQKTTAAARKAKAKKDMLSKEGGISLDEAMGFFE